MENSCDKSKTSSKTIRKYSINSSSKTPIVPKHPIFLVQRFSCKERTKRTILHKIRPKMSKELKVVMKKKKKTNSKKNRAQDTVKTAKHRPNSSCVR